MNTQNTKQDNRDSREIQQDIKATRGDMDQTLDRLNEKLTPRSLLNSALDWFENRPSSSPSKSSRSNDILQIAKENPLPVLVTGAGLAWLLMESKNSKTYGYSGDTYYLPADDASHNLRQSYGPGGIHSEAVRTDDVSYLEYDEDDDSPGIREKAKAAKDKLASAAGAVGDKYRNAKDGVSRFGTAASDRASAMRSGISSAHGSARSFAGKVSDTSQEKLRVVDQQFRQAVDEVPLGVGLGFLGLGVLAGLVIPRTQAEDELMGDAADELKDAAGEKGSDLLERGKAVAARVADKAASEAEKQGFTADSATGAASTVVDKLGSVVEAAKDEGKKAAKDEGLTKDGLKSEAKSEADKAKKAGEEKVKS